jgi:putative hydrolase of the HAD superfamily
MNARPRRYDAVLFDWDDTLCGAVPHRYTHAQEVARKLGVELTLPDVYRAFVRAGDSTVLSVISWDEFLGRVPEQLGIHPHHHADFLNAYRERDTYKTFQLFDDVLEVVEQIGHHELRVGVLSNNTEVVQHIERLDVHHHFEVIVSPHTYGVGKPHPEIFLRTAADMGVAAERTLYVGDSYDNDVVGARAAGMTPVLLDRFGINLDDLDAEHRVDNLASFAALLDGLLYG